MRSFLVKIPYLGARKLTQPTACSFIYRLPSIEAITYFMLKILSENPIVIYYLILFKLVQYLLNKFNIRSFPPAKSFS